MPDKREPLKAAGWMVTHNGNAILRTLASTEQASIDGMFMFGINHLMWEHYHSQGYDCIPVEITEAIK